MKKFLPILLLLIPALLPAQNYTISDDITATRLAKDVYLYTATSIIEPYGPVPSNGVIVVRGKEAALLDTPCNDAQTETLVNWIGKELHAKVKMFVPNHWHSDCMGGIGYLHSTGVKSYASELTRQAAAREGKPVPQQGFTDSLALDLHGTKIHCHYLGGGHTADNIVVWIPAAKVLFGGCMVKDMSATGLGNTAEAVPEEWPVTIGRVLDRFPEARIVVPGHGAYGGRELLVHTREMLDGAMRKN